MIKALLKKQLQELGLAFFRSSKTGKRRTRASAVGYGLLYGVLVVVLMLCFASMAAPLGAVLLPEGLDWLYFAFTELTALLVSVLACAFTSYSGLFQSKDNELLLSLPIPPSVIFGVRVATVWLTSLLYLLMAWVPAVVCYGLLAPRPLVGVVCSLPMALVLSGLSTILAVVLAWAVAAVSSRARHKSLVTVVCSLAFFALYYAGFIRVSEGLDSLVENAGALGAGLAHSAWPLRLLGGAAAGELPALVGLLVGTALCFVAFCKLLEGPYLRRMTQRRGTAPLTYKAKQTRAVSQRQALLRRELLHLGSSPTYLLNCTLATLALPLLGAAALWKAEPLGQFARASQGGFPVLVCCAVCGVAAMNLLTSPSISLEGRSLWLLQSLPLSPWQVLRAKLELHLLLTGVPAVACVLCVQAAVGLGQGSLWAVLLETGLLVVLMGSLGLVLGLMLPSLHWTSEAAVIKMSGCSLLSMAGNGAAVLVLTAVQMKLVEFVPAQVALWVGIALAAGADALLLRWLQTKGTARFAALS